MGCLYPNLEPEVPESTCSWRSLPDNTKIPNVRQNFRFFFAVSRIKKKRDSNFSSFSQKVGAQHFRNMLKKTGMNSMAAFSRSRCLKVPRKITISACQAGRKHGENTRRANATRLRVPTASNRGFEPDNRSLDHFSGSGGSERPLTSCLTTA